MSDNPVTLESLARQQEQILSELTNIRADHAVLVAIVQRMDATMIRLLNEVRVVMSDASDTRLLGEQFQAGLP